MEVRFNLVSYAKRIRIFENDYPPLYQTDSLSPFASVLFLFQQKDSSERLPQCGSKEVHNVT